MRVRHLQVQGFKTFASKTLFKFHEGITAIVGPNGSGKSNLADALRWVLGEQSYSTLRSRRTEDVIFSGSSARSPVGLAEVSLLLDNSDGYLPVDFAEVEISRRAHRSGSNEYFLNRRRVRLQDIQDVLGGLTSSYVVIHQGLVDEALSRRPQERRVLLEEAAEVHVYHERRQKAQQRLERTEANITRISDLRHELAPRLRKLERQAEHARQRAEVEIALRQEMRRWYRLLWEEGSTALQEMEGKRDAASRQLAQSRQALEQAVDEAGQLRQQLEETQRIQEERRRQEDALRRQQETLRQSLAQVEGERRALQRYGESLRAEIVRWRQDAAEQDQRRLEVEVDYGQLEQRVAQAHADQEDWAERLREAEVALQVLRNRREGLEKQLQAAANGIMEVEHRLEYLDAQRASLEREATERRSLLEDLSRQREQACADTEQAQEDFSRLEAELAELHLREDSGQASVAQARTDLEQTEGTLEQARWRLAESRARLEALAEGGNTMDGAPFLQAWARQQGRPAFVSFLSRLTFPQELQFALEAALGNYAWALWTETWPEAQEALAVLAKESAGQATLLPRQDLRPLADQPGVLAEEATLLLEHLDCPAEDRPALVALLGRVLLAPDGECARRVAREMNAGWCVVTPRGDLVTAEGVWRGGRISSEQSALVREQERRRLDQAMAEAERAVREQERALAAAQQKLGELTDALEAVRRQREEKRLQREERQAQLREFTRELNRLEGEVGRHRVRLDSLGQELRRVAEERDGISERLGALRSERAALQAELTELQQISPEAEQSFTQARERLQEARTVWAVARKERESQQSLVEMYQRNTERLRQQIAEGDARLEQTQSQLSSWEERAVTLQGQMDELAAALLALDTTIQPLRSSLGELTRLDERVSRCRRQALEWEGATSRAEVEVQRLQDRLKEILRRGLEEIGPEASAYGRAGEALLNALLENPPEWARTPLDGEMSAEELERRIALLREDLRRIGPVNPLAEEEYLQTRERSEFFDQQLQDLRDAARSVRQVIAELDASMEARFRETFAEINREFQAYFTRLFGGGTAQLRLVRLQEESEEGLAGLGVEILARPPGKRVHTLALLSGGERALTSSALLFAILKVNPRPFCLLDEVDAMLDEANVGRFRECLEELSAETQFIVITHNRVTVQSASTLYGVSLADDGTSRVLSLKLEEIVAG